MSDSHHPFGEQIAALAALFKGFALQELHDDACIGSLALRPVKWLASLADRTENYLRPRRLYFRACAGSVALPGVGYNYGVIWATSTGGTLTHWNGS